MAIITDFKAIKEAADNISKEICKSHKEEEFEVHFEPEESIAERLCVTKAPTPPPQGAQAGLGKAPRPLVNTPAAVGLSNCPRCGSRLKLKARGPFCLDCDEYM